jgi:type VI secretion system secreted protein VgrG
MTVNQDIRTMGIATQLPDADEVIVRRVYGREEISRPFSYELELISKSASITANEIVGTNATVRIDDIATGGVGEPRYLNGIIAEFGREGVGERFTVYRATLRPWFWFHEQTLDSRIFQKQTVPDIVRKVFSQRTLGEARWQVSSQYKERRYCVQYRESDFQFVSRLLEEEGIFYYFEHENGQHTMVLGDQPTHFQRVNDFVVDYPKPDDVVDELPQIRDWRQCMHFRPARFAQKDFNFKKPKRHLLVEESSRIRLGPSQALEVYEYPGLHQSPQQGRDTARVRVEEIETMHDFVEGTSTYRSFVAGGQFVVRGHRDPTVSGQDFTLVAVETQASVMGSYLTDGEDDESESELIFENRFEAITAQTPFRPARRNTKPVVEGPQTAVVVGPSGEEIYTDEFGRVKVQFHWDRLGDKNEDSSCWVRVSQTHAGQGWGTVSIPRIGEEVIVAFLDGDPDRPIIKGRVYNTDTAPPFALPGEMARSGMKSNTHQGSGFNEMTMDDTDKSQQVRTNAQFNMDSAVGNDMSTTVGNDHSEGIGVDDTLTIGVDSLTDIVNDRTLTVGNNHNVDVASNVVIEAKVAITLACGASTIHMNQAGVITISGQFVTSAATASNTIVAPLTEIAGTSMLNQAGLICLDLGGVCHVSGKSASVTGASVKVKGGEVVVQGAPIEIGQIGMPIVVIPAGGGGGGGAGPAGPGGPASAASAAAGGSGLTNPFGDHLPLALKTAATNIGQHLLASQFPQVAGILSKLGMGKMVANTLLGSGGKGGLLGGFFGRALGGAVGKVASGVGSVLGKIWTLPNTALGLVYGGLGHIYGEVGDLVGFHKGDPDIRLGKNGIEFHDNPFMLSAMTLGNVVIYGGGDDNQEGYAQAHPDAQQIVGLFDKDGHAIGQVSAQDGKPWELGTIRDHENRHIDQAELLGPLYLPYAGASYIMGVLTGGGTHGPNSPIEQSPHSGPPSAFGGGGVPQFGGGNVPNNAIVHINHDQPYSIQTPAGLVPNSPTGFVGPGASIVLPNGDTKPIPPGTYVRPLPAPKKEEPSPKEKKN